MVRDLGDGLAVEEEERERAARVGFGEEVRGGGGELVEIGVGSGAGEVSYVLEGAAAGEEKAEGVWEEGCDSSRRLLREGSRVSKSVLAQRQMKSSPFEHRSSPSTIIVSSIIHLGAALPSLAYVAQVWPRRHGFPRRSAR